MVSYVTKGELTSSLNPSPGILAVVMGSGSISAANKITGLAGVSPAMGIGCYPCSYTRHSFGATEWMKALR